MAKRSEAAPSPRKGINTRITDDLREQLEAAASMSGRSLGAEIEHRLLASFIAQPATVEDVRLMLRGEIRAALSEQRTPEDGSHPMRPCQALPQAASSEPKRAPSGIDALWALVLDFASVQCPGSVAEYYDRLRGRSGDPLFDEYMARQNARQEAFYRQGGDLTEFRAEEWGEFMDARSQPNGAAHHFGRVPEHT